MQIQILNSGLKALAEAGTNSGYWISLTHFSLAYANEIEQKINPCRPTMTELISTSSANRIDSTSSDYAAYKTYIDSSTLFGDTIYNIWQEPFAQFYGEFYNKNNNQLLSTDSLASNYVYEYDDCNSRNMLYYFNNGFSEFDPSSATNTYSGTYSTTTTSEGTSTTTYSSSELDDVSKISPLYITSASGIAQNKNGTYYTNFSKLFPIASWRGIKNNASASEVVVNFTLKLPPVAASITNEIETYSKGIGNFKFNRIGIYGIVQNRTALMTGDVNDANPIYTSAPVLFAVIDIGVSNSNCSTNERNIDIYKVRDDSGFSGWTYDLQIPLAIATSSSSSSTQKSFYFNEENSEAANYYLSNIESYAELSETVMQLQMMVLNLANRYKNLSNSTSLKSNAPVIKKLTTGTAVLLDSAYTKYIFDSSDFAAQYDSHGNLLSKSNGSVKFVMPSDPADGDTMELLLCNFNIRDWDGVLMFVNKEDSSTSFYKYDSLNADNSIYENIGSSTDIQQVSICFDFVYSSDLSTSSSSGVTTESGSWILTNKSVCDYTNYN